MKVLIAGANSYLGKRLLPFLLKNGDEVICLVSSKIGTNEAFGDRVSIIIGNLLNQNGLEPFPVDIDRAYYLANSKLYDSAFLQLEALSAHNFVQALNKTRCAQLVFLCRGSRLRSRRYIEHILSKARAVLSFSATVPFWYLIWPFYTFVLNKIINKVSKFAGTEDVGADN